MSASQSPVPQQESEESRSEEKKTKAPRRSRRVQRPAQRRKRLQWSVSDLAREMITTPDYEIDITVHPPEVVPRGSVLQPPVTAILRIRDPLTHKEIPARRHLIGLWAIASAVPKEYQGQPMASNAFMLCGSMVDSAHPFSDDSKSEKAGGTPGQPSRNSSSSYFTFPNLYFKEKGEYRIRVMLMKMETSGDSYGGCVMLKHAISQVVKVVDPTPSDEKHVLEFLLERGIAGQIED
ncbi:MAG: hypothetical protein M1840_005781 [Geoglossum simile]|nr:MAG: hypothetical protein M1840_005781 [Geoglossum simile]